MQVELAAVHLFVGDVQNALQIAEALPAGTRNTIGLPLLADIYLRQNRRDAVAALVPLMQKAARANPSLALQCAEMLRAAGFYRDGIGLLLSLGPAERNNVRVLLALTRLEIIAEDFVRARGHLAQATRLSPRSAEVLSLRAFVENSSGDADQALKLITEARRVAPASVAVLADFVALTLRIGKSALAFDAAKELFALEPDNLEFRYLLGVASLQSKNFGSALEALEPYVQANPNDFRGCLAFGIVLKAQSGQTDRARDQLTRCIELDPSNSEARYQLGLLYKSQGENNQAIRLLEEAVNRAPDHGFVRRDLGSLYMESGDDVRARTSLERAAVLVPKDADTHFQLVRLYNRIGENALAKQHQEIFQKLRGAWGKSTQ